MRIVGHARGKHVFKIRAWAAGRQNFLGHGHLRCRVVQFCPSYQQFRRAFALHGFALVRYCNGRWGHIGAIIGVSRRRRRRCGYGGAGCRGTGLFFALHDVGFAIKGIPQTFHGCGQYGGKCSDSGGHCTTATTTTGGVAGHACRKQVFKIRARTTGNKHLKQQRRTRRYTLQRHQFLVQFALANGSDFRTWTGRHGRWYERTKVWVVGRCWRGCSRQRGGNGGRGRCRSSSGARGRRTRVFFALHDVLLAIKRKPQ